MVTFLSGRYSGLLKACSWYLSYQVEFRMNMYCCISRERCRLHGQSEASACSPYFSILPIKLLPGKSLPGKSFPGKLLPAEYTVLVIRNFSCYELVRNFIALNGNWNEELTPIFQLES